MGEDRSAFEVSSSGQHGDSAANVALDPELRAQLTELKARYCRYLDCKRWEDLAQLFAPDGRMQFGPDPAWGMVQGREAIAEHLTEQLRRATTVHHVHPGEIELQDATHASAIWPMDDLVANWGYVLNGSGYYEEQYAFDEGRWMIQHSRLHRLRVDFKPTSIVIRVVLWLHKLGILKRLSPEAGNTLDQALRVGIAEGELK